MSTMSHQIVSITEKFFKRAKYNVGFISLIEMKDSLQELKRFEQQSMNLKICQFKFSCPMNRGEKKKKGKQGEKKKEKEKKKRP